MGKKNDLNPNQVLPTKKQRALFEHMKKAETLKEAMLKAGYDETTAINPHLIIKSRGFQALLEQYRVDLVKAGFSTEMLAEVQMEGLTDQDAKVRLEYIKETKKDFGIYQNENKINVNVGIGFKKEEYTF